ncbi:MAG: DUF3598 family protein [Phormidesmis sp.]
MSESSLSQWQRLLENVGTWQGSFTQLSPQGKILTDVPTEVALIPQDGGQAMRQEIHRYPPGSPAQTQVLEYRSLSRATLFFEGGAFSQGSTQWGPFSPFGAELGLIFGERRLRLVQLFDKSSELQQITLIREQLKGSTAPERDTLQLPDLIGTWRGEAVTQYADLRPDQQQATELTVEAVSDSQIRQTITFRNSPPISTMGTVSGQVISFTEGAQLVQVLLLPDGASATCPTRITPRQPLFLEAGWLLDAHTRQRLIRSYDATGAWASLTLVTEKKQ